MADENEELKQKLRDRIEAEAATTSMLGQLLKQQEKFSKELETQLEQEIEDHKKRRSELIKRGKKRTDAENRELKLIDSITDAKRSMWKASQLTEQHLQTSMMTLAKNQDEVGKGLKAIQWKDLKVSIAKLNKGIDGITQTLQKTQKDFGISIGAAGTLRANVLASTIQDTVQILQDINYSAIGSGLGDAVTSIGELFTGKDPGKVFKDLFTKLNQTVEGNVNQLVLPSERLEGISSVQNEFGILNQQMGEQIAQTAKNYGLSAQQLVQARRAFVTITRGDLSQVQTIQTRFLDQFKSRGMTPKVALEAVGRYAELIARNGTRFADSFARAAASAKLIGVDLGKIDQVGDNIISNFEGFLESQAELGAMGFGFEGARLAELAETGDTGALFDELRSQLMGMGKDITKLRRSERLALEGAFGINISELARAAGLTPKIATQEDLLKGNNTKLGQMLTLLQVGGPIFSALGPLTSILAALGPTGILATGVFGIFAWMKGKGNQEIAEVEKNKLLGNALLEQAKGMSEGPDKVSKINQAEKLLYKAADLEGKRLVSNTGTIGAGARAIEQSEEFKRNVRLQILDAIGSENVFKNALQGLNLQSNLIGPAVPYAPLVRPASSLGFAEGGLVNGPGTSTSDSIPARLSHGEYVLNAKAVSLLGTDTLDKLNNVQKFAKGGLVGLRSTLINAGLGMLGKKVPGLSETISNFKTGGVDTVKRSLLNTGLGMLGKKVPGLSGVTSAISAFKEGGVKGALGSLAKGGIGKAIGGAIGTAIPIPGVGTMIGSMLGSKVGKFAGSLFGRGRSRVTATTPQEMQVNPLNNLLGLMGGMSQGSTRQELSSPPTVDVSGIEKQLNMFIQALSNIQVNMDGAKVGQLLVRADQVAATTGVFRAQR